ncbi:MAG: zinc-binding dehydrogenase [Armatimonadia bacterium]|nr:zinc-binding dehydrogenase [Armatimonadia bacterium]
MPIQAKAVVFPNPEEVIIGTVTVPDPGPGEVLVRTTHSLISNGTEGWIWSGRFHSPGGDRPYEYPVVPGYQRVGVIESLGEQVSGLSPGQRVFATVGRLDPPHTAFSGSHAEWGITPADQCLPLPDGLDPIKASGLVLTQVGYNGAFRPPVEKGSKVLVIGDGLVGQWAAQGFRARGAEVVLLGRHHRRMELARAHSADVVLDDGEIVAAHAILDRWPDGADIVDEAVGRIANVEMAFQVLRHDGHLVFNGYHPEGEHLMSIQWMHDKEITCWGMAGWTRQRLEATLRLIQEGAFKVTELVTHAFPGVEADRAYRMIRDRSEPFLGVVLEW